MRPKVTLARSSPAFAAAMPWSASGMAAWTSARAASARRTLALRSRASRVTSTWPSRTRSPTETETCWTYAITLLERTAALRARTAPVAS